MRRPVADPIAIEGLLLKWALRTALDAGLGAMRETSSAINSARKSGTARYRSPSGGQNFRNPQMDVLCRTRSLSCLCRVHTTEGSDSFESKPSRSKPNERYWAQIT